MRVYFTVANDKTDQHLHLFHAFMTYLTFSYVFPIFLGYVVHLQLFFKLLQISKKFSNTCTANTLHRRGPVLLKPVLFKGQGHITGLAPVGI